jgi:hypothetical protein
MPRFQRLSNSKYKKIIERNNLSIEFHGSLQYMKKNLYLQKTLNKLPNGAFTPITNGGVA